MGSIRLIGVVISIFFGMQSFMSDTVNFPPLKVGCHYNINSSGWSEHYDEAYSSCLY